MNFHYYSIDQNSKYVFVSCFYPIKQGVMRHPINVYKERACRLFNTFNKDIPLYIFTTDEGKIILQSSKIANGQIIPLTPNIKFITKYQSIFDVPRIAKHKSEYKEIAEVMQNESYYTINLEIGAIWTSKLIFLQEVVENYSKESKLFFWIDIGAMKSDEIINRSKSLEWPSIERIEKIFSFETDNQFQDQFSDKVYTNKILFWGVVRTFPKIKSFEEVNLKKYDYFVVASFFGGPRDKMISFLNEYWRLHDFLLKKKDFVLREEFMLAAYVGLNKNDVFMVDMQKQKCRWYESCVGFIAKSNVCKFDNSVYVFATRRNKFVPVAKPFDSWL